MRLIQQFVLALSLGFVAMTAGATPNPVNGVHYRTLQQPQPTDSGGKVEVLEFFWYACPHCNSFEPALNEWVKKQGNNIVFKRVPVKYRDSFVPQQRLYYTLEEMGKLDQLHGKIFEAIHVGRQTLDTDESVINFIEKNGIDKNKFLSIYKSFGINTKINRALQLQDAYNVDGVPMIAIDGRYVTAPSIVGSSMGRQPEKVLEQATLQVMSALVAKAAKEKPAAAESKPAAAPAKAAPAAKPNDKATGTANK